VVALLVQNLDRLDEKTREDSDGVHNILAIVENMCEVRNQEVCVACGEQGLLVWLLKRVRLKSYDNNKLYAAEILAILLQGNAPNQKLLGEKGGIDILLQSLAYYKRRDPNSADEVEMVENLFDSLCSALMFTPNRERFLRGEGLQLMILMLKEKKMSRKSSLKVLNHAMVNKEGAENCTKFIEVYGLRCLFPAFMKTPRKIIKDGGSEVEHEEHTCSIIMSLFKNIQGALRERLVGKFVENDHEKVERLIELHFKYQRKVREGVRAAGIEEEDETSLYLRRLDSGLYILQMVDYIIAELCTSSVSSIATRLGILLNQHGDSLKSVKETLYEHAQNLGGSDPNATEHAQTAGAGVTADNSNGTAKKEGVEDEVSERALLLQLADKL
jgi:beta-catenin-like protein 1